MARRKVDLGTNSRTRGQGFTVVVQGLGTYGLAVVAGSVLGCGLSVEACIAAANCAGALLGEVCPAPIGRSGCSSSSCSAYPHPF